MAIPRRQRNPHDEGEGNSVRLQDCRVWAEINYLDSPTDYRECLREIWIPSHQIQCAALTMLDTQECCWRQVVTRLLLVLATIVTLVVSGYLLFSGLDLI